MLEADVTECFYLPLVPFQYTAGVVQEDPDWRDIMIKGRDENDVDWYSTPNRWLWSAGFW